MPLVEGLRRLAMAALLLLLTSWAGAGAAETQPIALWTHGAPGAYGRTSPERVRMTEQGEHIVSNVQDPSITPFIPRPGKATGAAVIVVPGGGHRELWMDHEGYRVGRWLRDHGVAAFVLKYRLAREEGSTYTVEGDALGDLQRAIRLVKSRSGTWGIAADRVGVIGFSAGGELAALAGSRVDPGRPNAEDPIDRENSRPDFMALIYPAMPRGMALSDKTPPAFLLCGEKDDTSESLAEFYVGLRRAGASAELHVIAGAGHGFGMRDSNPPAVRNWPDLFLFWLGAQGFIGRR